MEEQLANPDFKDDCYYMPFMELDEKGEPVYSEFFSGQWSWTQCVRFFITENGCVVFNCDYRMKLQRILLHMDRSLYLLLVAAIKRLCLLVLVIKSFTQCM